MVSSLYLPLYVFGRMKEMQDIKLSDKTYKLEQDPYIYQLQDVENPELFREMFP